MAEEEEPNQLSSGYIPVSNSPTPLRVYDSEEAAREANPEKEIIRATSDAPAAGQSR